MKIKLTFVVKHLLFEEYWLYLHPETPLARNIGNTRGRDVLIVKGRNVLIYMYLWT